MATTPESRRLPRFGRTERAVHWVHATAFMVLLVTGLCLYLPSLSELVSRRPLLKGIHIWTAVGWAVALVPELLGSPASSLGVGSEPGYLAIACAAVAPLSTANVRSITKLVG